MFATAETWYARAAAFEVMVGFVRVRLAAKASRERCLLYF